jgi:hypothetical protein
VLSGGSFDRWDIQVRAGPLGLARVRLGVEEHGHGRQLLRFRVWPRWSHGGSALAAVFAFLAALAVERASLETATVLGAVSFAVLVQMVRQCAASVGLCLRALEREASRTEERAELTAALEGGVAKARSQVHVVVD